MDPGDERRDRAEARGDHADRRDHQPTYFQPQAAAAKAAGIPIITVLNEDLTQPMGPEVTARVAQPYDLAARLSVDFIVKDTNCAANVLVLTSKEVIGSPASIDAVNDEFKKYCPPNCRTTFQNVSVPDWSTQITNITRSAIQSDPTINYVMPLYDSMSQFVVPGIQLAGATGKVHISTFNGTPFVLKMMQDADVVKMDVGGEPVAGRVRSHRPDRAHPLRSRPDRLG